MAVTDKQKAFYDKYYQTVADSLEGTGLFPEVVINQMGLETGWGESELNTKHNNFFGMKKGGANVPSVNMSSDEEVDGKKVSKKSDFRKYDSLEDSIDDYVKVMKNQGGGETYKEVLAAKTPEAQAEALGNSPYATGSNYGNDIQGFMAEAKTSKSYGGTQTFRMPTEEEMEGMTAKDKYKKLDDDIYKDKQKRKEDFERGAGNKKDRFLALEIKSREEGLTKKEWLRLIIF